MTKKNTNKDLREKLNQTSVPDYKEGWESMQTLLPKTSWIKRSLTNKKTISVAAIALILLGFFFWKWAIHKSDDPAVPTLSSAMTTPNNTVDQQHTPEKDPPDDITSNATAPLMDSTIQLSSREERDQNVAQVHKNPKTGTTTNEKEEIQSPAEQDLSFIDDTVQRFDSESPKMEVIDTLAQSATFMRSTKVGIGDDQHFTDAIHPEKDDLNHQKKHPLHLDIAINGNSGAAFAPSKINRNPLMKGAPIDLYPSIHLSKDLSSKIMVAVGLSPYSSVRIPDGHLHKDVSNNNRNLSSMAAFSKDKIDINKLYYWDLSLEAYYRITPKIALGTGPQFSLLDRVVGKKQRIDYSTSNTIYYVAPSSPRPQNLTSDKNAKSGIKSVDLRWLISSRYQLTDRWDVLLEFQYGLTKIAHSDIYSVQRSQNRNKLLKLGIGFTIK